MQKATIPLLILLLLSVVSSVSAEVYLGPQDTSTGNVTLTNSDGSYYFFDSTNASRYSYVTNMADGWWNISALMDTDTLAAAALVVGLFAFALAAVVFARRRTTNNEY